MCPIKRISLTACAIFFCTLGLQAQVKNVGITDGPAFTPDSAALLELRSAERGFLISRLTTVARDAIISPPEALMIYNTTTQCLEIYVSGWHSVWCDSCQSPAMPAAISGDTVFCAGDSAGFYVAPVAGATAYQWTVPAGWTITSGQGSNSISVIAGSTGQNGVVTVAASNNCGSGPAQSLPLSVSANSNVIGIRVCTGFYGYSAGDSSVVTITFNQPYTGVNYITTCSGTCTCSGTGTTFVQQTSGGNCLGTCLNARDFLFTTLPTQATVHMVGHGVHSYYPRFYRILAGGIIDYVTVIATCNNPDPYLYSNWNETTQCTFIPACP